MQQYTEIYVCLMNSDGLTLLDDTVSLPQVDMLNNFLDSTLMVSKRLAICYTVNTFA